MIAPLDPDASVARIAAAIGEPARTRMLFALLDDRARSSTELAAIADVGPSTASVHLGRLTADGLITVVAQGKHRYYSLAGPAVAGALESLSVLAGERRPAFVPPAPDHLRAARTCYDHIAGSLGVMLHDRLRALDWLAVRTSGGVAGYDVAPAGSSALEGMGVDVAGARALRRCFASACLDWSERRPHVGGAVGAALLTLALRRKWVARVRDSRALTVSGLGRRELRARFGLSELP